MSPVIMDCRICGHTWNMVDPPICAFCRIDRVEPEDWFGLDEEE